MTDDQPEQNKAPTSKELRDARRQAHEAQKNSSSNKGGDKKGKGKRQP